MKNLQILTIEELNERYIRLFPSDGVDELVLSNIEESLNLKLPSDFREIASFYSGGSLGGFSVFAFVSEGVSPNVVDETIRLRHAINLPSRFIVLAEPPESLIVMDAENTSLVIWCDASDVVRLNDKLFLSSPQIWDSFLEFFINMLEDEETENAE